MPLCDRFRWTLALFLAGLCSASALAQNPVAKQRTNVLFIVSDDLNNVLGCYGDRQIQTPNIDKLAARGIRFDRAYCAFPLCGPSRNAMLTGLYPNTNGIQANGQIFRQTIPQQLSLPQAFRQQGYFAARIGKMYHYNVPNSIGTNGHDDPASWELELNPAGVDRTEEHPFIKTLTPKQFGGTLSWYASPQSDEHHTDAQQAEDAEWVLERCAKRRDRPFFLSVGFFRPHTPYVSPKGYFDQYELDEMAVVPGVAEDQKDLPAGALGSYKKEQDKLTDDLRREARQAYYASISFMDAQVGKVVEALDRLGLADSTVIVFTSDHGYHLGEHGLWQKMSLFEESARVPLLIVAPGVKPGVAMAPVSHIDLFPTLAKLCDVKAPENLQGQDLTPMLRDPSLPGRNWAITQVSRGGGARQAAVTTNVAADGKFYFGYSLRTPRWRYTEWDAGKRGRELYDHDADPREQTNLAEVAAHADTVREFSEQMAETVKTTLPPSGEIPEIQPGLWAPTFVDP